MLDNGLPTAELLEIEEIEITAPEKTGPWRESGRFSPVNWGIEMFLYKKRPLGFKDTKIICSGNILNMSADGLAFRLDLAGQVNMGDRFRVRLETRDEGLVSSCYHAIVEVVRSCEKSICFARFIIMPRELEHLIHKELRSHAMNAGTS